MDEHRNKGRMPIVADDHAIATVPQLTRAASCGRRNKQGNEIQQHGRSNLNADGQAPCFRFRINLVTALEPFCTIGVLTAFCA